MNTHRLTQIKRYGLAQILILVTGFWLLVSGLYAQETPAKKMTEGEFAVKLVKMMKLQRLLPPAPLAEDCIRVLEQFGIAPLTGWNANRELTKENYAVVIAMASGKEGVVGEKAQEACDKNVDIINQRWQLKYNATNRWPALDELFKDTALFPKGRPVCPYRARYEDKDGDHKVDIHNHLGRHRLKREGEEKRKAQPLRKPEEAAKEKVGDIELVPGR